MWICSRCLHNSDDDLRELIWYFDKDKNPICTDCMTLSEMNHISQHLEMEARPHITDIQFMEEHDENKW